MAAFIPASRPEHDLPVSQLAGNELYLSTIVDDPAQRASWANKQTIAFFAFFLCIFFYLLALLSKHNCPHNLLSHNRPYIGGKGRNLRQQHDVHQE